MEEKLTELPHDPTLKVDEMGFIRADDTGRTLKSTGTRKEEVMPTEVEAKRAEEMISRWLEYNSRWMELDGTPITFDRSYVLDYRLNSMPIDPESVDVHGDTVVVIYMALDDELNNATLLAVFTDGDMRYLTAEVDTSWLDVWHQGEGYRHLPST